MENNTVHLSGTVKRDAEANDGILDFALCVASSKGRIDIFDCRLTRQSAAYAQLEGFVNEGERIEVMGHLEKRTSTESQRIAGVMVDVRNTCTFVYVDSIVETED